MSDRKYRQRGYQDDDRSRPPKPAPPQPAAPRDRIGPRTYNMPGYREVVRCARCGNVMAAEIAMDTRCTRCGADLHACVQCVHFDTGARFECVQKIEARVAPKDARNTCTLFDIQRRVERETSSPAPNDARKAFDDLFK
jgi:hypothetical protein